ncbi:conserved hypothetical protein [Alteromonas sp. 38]|uniref:hypothetical protein n=2 Tax=Alteromonas TaxID=226 RepID=UPI0012F1D34F|nr:MULTISPECIES: hypothetical protein [unclassified Alteromonas]CAD5275957.1 conserved hypothetical protein [Alteromonas sp. 154]VXB67072.1 conserved hypothetical protein [Alteromonas sp. 38]
MYKKSLDVICLGNIKEAALYFDRVIPVQCNALKHNDEGPYVTLPEEVPVRVATDLIYGNSAPDYKILEFMTKKWSPFVDALHKEFNGKISRYNVDDYRELYEKSEIGLKGASIRSHFLSFASTLGVQKPTILLKENNDSCDFETAYLNVSMKGIDLIDTSSASWDQIMELRMDTEAHKSLRNLRLFIYENYVGKPSSYIFDDVSKRLDVYSDVSKKHGFELTTSVLSVLLDSKNIQASLAAGLAASFFGGAELAVGAACAVELGKGSLELAKKYHPIQSFKLSHELAYLIKAQEVGVKC